MSNSRSGKKLLASTKKDPAFLINGFTYWKEATTAFQRHQASMCHREATEALINLPKQVQGDIGELLNKEHLAAKAHNRKMFLIILESIRFLARQGLPLRGHLSDADSNFIQILHLQGRVAFPEIENRNRNRNRNRNYLYNVASYINYFYLNCNHTCTYIITHT